MVSQSLNFFAAGMEGGGRGRGEGAGAVGWERVFTMPAALALDVK